MPVPTLKRLCVSIEEDINKMNWRRLIGVCLIWASFSCSLPEEKDFYIGSQTFDFNESDHGWVADYTDYPATQITDADTVYKWHSEYTYAPSSVGRRKAIMLSCNNVNGDIFMFIKKKIGGFKPNATYNVVFEIELASDALAGQGVILKAGASELEPKKIIEDSVYTLNIDKGVQYNAGENVVVVGDIGNIPTQSTNISQIIQGNSSSASPLITRSNSKGEIWLLVGTDSSFTGSTTVYYTKVNVVFSASE